MPDDVSESPSAFAAYVPLRDLSTGASAPGLGEVLDALHERSTVVIDCSGVSDVPAETLSALVRAARRRTVGQPRMVLRGPSVYVRALFEECGLGRIFEIE